jgi:hypothetical protein
VNKKIRSLVLNRTTIRALTRAHLQNVAGGVDDITNSSLKECTSGPPTGNFRLCGVSKVICETGGCGGGGFASAAC